MRKGLGGAAALGVLVALSACGGGSVAASGPSTTQESLIQKSIRECALAGSAFMSLGDDGNTLTLQGAPQYGEGLSFDQIKCVVATTGGPDSVADKMGQTRALDGMQSAIWGPYEATWTYHPDHGMNVILTKASK
jgi:hypothetical protein